MDIGFNRGLIDLGPGHLARQSEGPLFTHNSGLLVLGTHSLLAAVREAVGASQDGWDGATFFRN